MPPYRNYIIEYHLKIQLKRVVAGKWIKLIYGIIVAGLENGEYIFDAKKANKAIRFIENFCHHSKGRNDLIVLELWQKAMICCIFGIVDDQKIRIFREVFIVIARKNGKSLLASAIMTYSAYMEDEYGQEIYCIAPKLEQTRPVFEGFYEIVLADQELEEMSHKTRTGVRIEETNTTVKPIAFSAKKSDGFNPHLVICDEVAAWSCEGGLKQYEVMKSALGARIQPIILSISTAGDVNDSIFDELMARSTSFLKGSSKERRLLPFIYMIDDVEKWDDIEELKKANPNMGVSVFSEYFEEEIIVAKTSLSKKAEFLKKYCNVKQNSSVAWLSTRDIEKCKTRINENTKKPYTLEDFRGHYAVIGIDLSKTTDLTAACFVIEKNGINYSFTKFFMPENKIEELTARDNVPYDIFMKKGILKMSGENHVDYRDVENWIIETCRTFKIYALKIGYDRNMAMYLVDDLKGYGLHCDDVHQGDNLHPVLIEFEGIIKDGNYSIIDNNLLVSHFLNVAVKENLETRKTRPVKIEQRSKIDGFVANVCAMTVKQKYSKEIGLLLKNEGR